MKELECPNCGAKLKEEDIDESGERGKCPYCSTILDFQRPKIYVHSEHNTYYGKPIKLKKNSDGEYEEMDVPSISIDKETIDNVVNSPHAKAFSIVFLIVFGIIFISIIITSYTIFNKAFSTMDIASKNFNQTTTTTIVSINPFDSSNGDYINVTFSGVNGNGVADVHIPSKYSKLTYTQSKSNNLSNGEEVEIVLSGMENYPNIIFTKTSGKAVVNGLSEPLTQYYME